jgi:SAM-dependent methyltransferase
VFRPKLDGTLELVGDFEGLYQAEPDPWQQSGDPGQHSDYYLFSRGRLFKAVQDHASGWGRKKILEVGCGHGHVTALLNMIGQCTGLDVSPTAIARAKVMYSNCDFLVGDITDPYPPRLPNTHHAIVLGQVFWYILHEFDRVMQNCYDLLSLGGVLIISQAFLKGEQRYGQELANGFDGALRLLLEYDRLFQLVEARYDDSDRYTHHDGLLVLRKR